MFVAGLRLQRPYQPVGIKLSPETMAEKRIAIPMFWIPCKTNVKDFCQRPVAGLSHAALPKGVQAG
jgi:hypothetical protein